MANDRNRPYAWRRVVGVRDIRRTPAGKLLVMRPDRLHKGAHIVEGRCMTGLRFGK
jgi:hypothetical protein